MLLICRNGLIRGIDGLAEGFKIDILVASVQAERPTARVVFTTHANPALRATLSQGTA